MRFSEVFSIKLSRSDVWFDTIPTQDSPLYIDPYLIFEDNDAFWSGTYGLVVEFFELATELVLKSGGETDTPAWRKAERLLHFPEPKEFALGLSMLSPEGAGTGKDFARKIAGVLKLVGKSGVENLAAIAGFALFTDGLGRDRTSDILCNILKSQFISYTELVAQQHGLKTEQFTVRHASWDRIKGNWIDVQHQLPASPTGKGPVLLTPKRFLKDIPQVTPERFWDWAEQEEFSALRDDLNFDLSESLSRSEKVKAARKVALKKPDIALRYLQEESQRPHIPYDIAADPDGRIRWFEDGNRLATIADLDALKGKLPADEDGFHEWVDSLAASFRHVVENNGGWRLLWNDGFTKPREERITQALAGIMWRAECRAENVDLSREVDMGRGPVDFKFSQGWSRRALLEVKYIHSSKFFTGATKQLPKYLQVEELNFGVYLAVGFNDSDFERDRIKRVEDSCKAMSAEAGITIKPVFVDARATTKASASKL